MSSIRRATTNDVVAIGKLLEQVLLVHHVGRPDLFKEKGQKFTNAELEAKILDDSKPIYVFVDDEGKVIGHCFCEIIEKKESSNAYAIKTLYIDDLCIDENARGQHVGKQLYEYVKNYAKENGFYNVTLHAWECNQKAVGFYEHLGMKVQQYTMEEILD